jgi:hypothetical protein
MARRCISRLVRTRLFPDVTGAILDVSGGR